MRFGQLAMGETDKGNWRALSDALHGLGVLSKRDKVEFTGADDEEARQRAARRVGVMMFRLKHNRKPENDQELQEFTRDLPVEVLEGEE